MKGDNKMKDFTKKLFLISFDDDDDDDSDSNRKKRKTS